MEHIELKKQLAEYNSIYKETDQLYHHISNVSGLSDCAFWILYTLRVEKQLFTQTELCEWLYLPKQTVNSALKKLADEGYLTLRFDEGSRKKKYIYLTEAGRRLTAGTVDRVIKAEQDAFLRLSEDEQALFLKLCHRYVDGLRAEFAGLEQTEDPDPA